MIVSEITAVTGLQALESLRCSRMIFDPHELTIEFDGEGRIIISCEACFRDGLEERLFNPDLGSHLRADLGVQTLVGREVRSIYSEKFALSLSFEGCTLSIDIEKQDGELLSIWTKQGGGFLIDVSVLDAQ